MEIKRRLAAGIYNADQLPPDAQRESAGTNLAAAEDVARRCHAAVRLPDGRPFREFAGETFPAQQRAGRHAINRAVKPLEESALSTWAGQSGMLLDGHEFQRHWQEQGERGGHENDVYFDEASQRWFKRNNLSMHGSWLEFLQRLMLHNYLFPETAVTFEGLIVNELKLSAELQELSERSTALRAMIAARGAGLVAVFSQPTVLIARRYVSHEELVHHMTKLGYEFVPRSNETFINREAGIVVRDLHDANVVFNAPGEIVIIDPVPVMDSTSKLDRLRRESAERNDAWIN